MPGARCSVPGARCLRLCLVLVMSSDIKVVTVLGAQCPVLGARCLVPGARCSVPGARCSVLSAWCLVLGARCPVLGARWLKIFSHQMILFLVPQKNFSNGSAEKSDISLGYNLGAQSAFTTTGAQSETAFWNLCIVLE